MLPGGLILFAFFLHWQVSTTAPWYVRHFPGLQAGGKHHRAMIQAVIWDGSLQGCFGSDPEKAQQLFLEHIEEVKRVSATYGPC